MTCYWAVAEESEIINPSYEMSWWYDGRPHRLPARRTVRDCEHRRRTPSHGLSIKNEIEASYEGEVNHGRLYPNLDQLVEMGLVEKGTLDKRTNSYTLTDRGYQELEARREWEDQRADIET